MKERSGMKLRIPMTIIMMVYKRKQLELVTPLLCVVCSAKCFPWVFSTALWIDIVISLILRWGNQGMERRSNLPKVIWLLSVELGLESRLSDSRTHFLHLWREGLYKCGPKEARSHWSLVTGASALSQGTSLWVSWAHWEIFIVINSKPKRLCSEHRSQVQSSVACGIKQGALSSVKGGLPQILLDEPYQILPLRLFFYSSWAVPFMFTDSFFWYANTVH